MLVKTHRAFSTSLCLSSTFKARITSGKDLYLPWLSQAARQPPTAPPSASPTGPASSPANPVSPPASNAPRPLSFTATCSRA